MMRKNSPIRRGAISLIDQVPGVPIASEFGKNKLQKEHLNDDSNIPVRGVFVQREKVILPT
jgi:hypothetical protein